MKKSATPKSVTFPGKLLSQFSPECCWFDDATILDMDYFVKTVSGIKAKGVRPDLVGSIITYYASKWVPELSPTFSVTEKGLTQFEESTESVTVSWMKKRFFIETLVGMLPPEKDSVPCNFLLRVLRTSNMVGVESAYTTELEKRISWQLDQAPLQELMIPSFSHTCGTLLDVEMVTRLAKRFVSLDSEGAKSGAALVKVAKLVDSYLAEAALDSNLSFSEFVELAGALPSHARATDDGLYRAIDTYLKAHPTISKLERKALCRLMDSRKLTLEASLHAAQNERLPVRAVIQVLFSEQTKLSHQIDWSGSFSGFRSPISGFDAPPGRCQSKREVAAQQLEMKRLKDDVYRLQNHCDALQAQMERMMEKKKGFFMWRKIGMPSISKSVITKGKSKHDVEGEVVSGPQTPADLKTKLVRRKNSSKWRNSTS